MLSTLSNMEMEIDSLLNHIDIFWDEYELREVKRYVLVRKRYSIPRNIKDGATVYKGLDTMYSDTNIKNGDLYYYRLFICLSEDEHSNDVISDSNCVVKAIGFVNVIDYGIDIYDTFPEQVKYDDEKQKISLPLKRFMQLIAFTFNRLDTYADTMLQQMDIEKCDEMYLPYMAKWLGLDYNAHLGADMNRLIIKTWNEIKPYMNTENGVRYLLQRIFRAECDIDLSDGVNVDIKFVGDNNIWLLRYVDYVKRLIQKFCDYSINYDFVVHIIDTVERYITGWDNYALDIIHELSLEQIVSDFKDKCLDLVKEMSVEDNYVLGSDTPFKEKAKQTFYEVDEHKKTFLIIDTISELLSEYMLSVYKDELSDFLSHWFGEIGLVRMNGFTNDLNSLTNDSFYVCADVNMDIIAIDKGKTFSDEIFECTIDEEFINSITESINEKMLPEYDDNRSVDIVKDMSIGDNYNIYDKEETLSDNIIINETYNTKNVIEELIDEIKYGAVLEVMKHKYIDEHTQVDDKAIYNHERWGFTNATTGLTNSAFYTCDNII